MVATPPLWGQESPDVSTTPPVAAGTGAGDAPVEITADGQNTFVGDIATADNNVVVRSGGDVVYADHVIYDRSQKLVTALGNVRIFSKGRIYRGNSIVYNLETKAMTSSNFVGAEYPKFVSGKELTTPGPNHYRLIDGTFTTSNREKPSFHMQAGTIEYRPDDEVVLKNVVLYFGDVPVMYFPIFVQSLTDSRPTYNVQIGDGGNFGAFIDTEYNWVAGSHIRGTVEFDAREKRGYAGGVDVQYYPSVTSDMLLKTYYAQDNLYSKTTTPNAVSRGDLSDSNTYDGVRSDNRYRVAYQHHLDLGSDFSSIADLNLWSDPWVTRDYFSAEYQQENQPPNFIQISQYNPNYNVSLLASPQVNPFFESVVRLPEFLVESKQQKIFDSPIEWTSQSSMVNFQRKYADLQYFQDPGNYIYNSFPNGSGQSPTAYGFYHPNATYGYDTTQQNNYSAFRYDTYQEFAYPHQYFNFLSLTPRAGARLTYYSDNNDNINDTANDNGMTNDKITQNTVRAAADVGLSGDFKVSRTWMNASSPNLGISGIRHVVEPFFDAQYAPEPTVTPNDIRGFDNRLYSTQLQPLDWTEYNSIDSIDKQAVVRFGTWNKIQTKRNGGNYDLATLETYVDADFDHNFSASTSNSTMSNLFNDLRINPTRELTFDSFSSVDMTGSGYNQLDNSFSWMPDPSLKLSLGDHYINHSPIFGDSNTIAFGIFYRLNEHWQFEAQEQYEVTTGHLQNQQYTIYRDLDSWQAALTFSDSQYNGQDNATVFVSFTLKAFPQYKIHTPRL